MDNVLEIAVNLAGRSYRAIIAYKDISEESVARIRKKANECGIQNLRPGFLGLSSAICSGDLRK